jgi:hypothetical protein
MMWDLRKQDGLKKKFAPEEFHVHLYGLGLTFLKR